MCFPKGKVKSIELCPEYVGDSAIESPDGQAHRRLFYTLRFICDGKRAFHSGLISPDGLDGMWEFLPGHFPRVELHVVPLAEEKNNL